jgi:hypothetical protein
MSGVFPVQRGRYNSPFFFAAVVKIVKTARLKSLTAVNHGGQRKYTARG